MPRPEQTPPARFSGLPYGANAELNSMSSDIPEDEDLFDDGFDEFDELAPPGPEEEFLLSPTDRPGEPVTAGLGFGAGPNIPSALLVGESKQDFAARVAQELTSAGGSVKGVAAFADRIARGL